MSRLGAPGNAILDPRASPLLSNISCLLQRELSLNPAEKQLKGPTIDLLFVADDCNQLSLSFLCGLGKPVNPTVSAFTEVLFGNTCWGREGQDGTTLGSQSLRGLDLGCVPEPGQRPSISSAQLGKKKRKTATSLGWVPGGLRRKG